MAQLLDPFPESMFIPKYDPQIYDNDLCILTLQDPIPFNQATIAPICLGQFHVSNFGGKVGSIAGWGTTWEYVLKKSKIPIISKALCQEFVSRL